jgi:chemotaxis protein CheX
MDVKYVNPFINAVVNTMETMLGVAPERMSPSLKNNNVAQGDISSIIGFAGDNVHGSIALSFPTLTALKIYHRMMGEVINKINKDVEDTIGELVNIVAGGAKTELENEDVIFHISIPSVIIGKNHTIAHKGSIPVVLIPFKWEKGTFVMEISMKVDAPRAVSVSASQREAVPA